MVTPINQVTPKEGIVVGLIAAGAGVMVMLRAANVIQAGKIYAPPWVVAVCGFIFVLVGTIFLYHGIRNAVGRREAAPPPAPDGFPGVGWLMAGLLITGFGLIGAWIAFGPGERTFEGGITGSATEGRIAFGIGTAITLAVAAYVWVKGVQELIARWRGKRRGGPPKQP